jgi:tetratricopeptide (TPR) repeat protein
MAHDEKILPTRDHAFAWRLGPGLRESAVDASAFNGALDRIVDDIATARSQPAQLLALLTRVAPLLRIAGRLEEARKTAAAAIAIAELVEDSDAVFKNQLALAQVLQRERRFEISTPLFDQLIVQARSSPAFAERLHDVLFGAGVNLFEQQRYAQAAKCFRESQQLRRESGREDLLEISAEALRQTRDAENNN